MKSLTVLKDIPMNKIKLVILIAFFLVAALSIHAQQKEKSNPKVIDLGELTPGETFISNEDKKVIYDTVILKNAIPGFVYDLEINKETETLEALKFPALSPEITGFAEEKLFDSCTELRNAIKSVDIIYNERSNDKSLKQNTTEPIERVLAKKIKELTHVLNEEKCTNESLKSLGKETINKSYKKTAQNIIVNTGDKVTIKIRRDNLEWTYVINGKLPGKWLTSYGFAFSSMALERPTYYTAQLQEDSLKFKVLKSRKPHPLDFNYIPAVFFSFFPSRNLNKCFNPSITAGLGFDLSSPVIFIGCNFMFWSNVGLSVGGVLNQQYRLKDQYTENEIIGSSLEKDQLHDKVYRPNLFFAINFRFGENPFKTNQSNSTNK